MTKLACHNETETQAKYWLWRIEQGLSQQERQAFVAWVNQDNKHHASLRKYSRSVTTAKLLAEFNGLFPLERKTSNKTKTFIYRMSLAASVVFFGIITSEIFFNNSLSQLFQRTSMPIVHQQYSTTLGEQTRFDLPDGSKVQLNTNSLLTISFSDNHRQLNLIKGEALFEVAKDKSRPFSVSSGEQSFTALGTIFNVQKSKNNQLELIVTEGRVLIADSNESLSTLTRKIVESTLQENNNIVVAGEKAIIDNKTQLPKSELSSEALSHELAWQKGMLIFDGESLNNALDEIGRYTDIRFTIEDKQLANIKVAGYFKVGDITSLLDSLSDNFGLTYKEIDNNTIVINKATIEKLNVSSSF